MDPEQKKPQTPSDQGSKEIRTLESDMRAFIMSQNGGVMPAGAKMPDMPEGAAAAAQKKAAEDAENAENAAKKGLESVVSKMNAASAAAPSRPEIDRSVLTAEPQEVRSVFQNPFLDESGGIGQGAERKPMGIGDQPFGESFDDKAKSPAKGALEEGLVAPIHTFTSDVADVVKNENVSMATVIATQEAADSAQGAPIRSIEEEESSSIGKTLLIAIAGLFFLAAGAGLVYYFFFVYKTTSVVPVASAPQIFFQPDQTVNVSVSGPSDPAIVKNILSAFSAATAGKVVRISFSTPNAASADAGSILSLLQTSAPNLLSRSFDPDFFFGVDGNAGGGRPFLIFKTQSFSSTDAGMLAWEPSMVKDLQCMFLKPSDQLTAPVFIVNAAGASYAFKSAVISNKDVRAAEDPSGKIVLLYSFIDAKTLVIAPDPATLKDVINRLTEAQIVR